MLTIACENALTDIIGRDELIPLVAIVMGCLIGMLGVVFGSLTGLAKVRAREVTKRELAAYVAEGSITSEDAMAILKEGRRSGCWKPAGKADDPLA